MWNGLLHGDLGRSVNLRREVGPDLRRYFPATLELVLAALLVAVLLGIPLGLVSAVYRDRWPDQIARFLSLAGVSLPGFWLAIILQIKIAFEAGWLPISGRYGRLAAPPQSITGFFVVDSLLTLNPNALQLSLKYLALPALCLSFGALATVARTVRADALEVLGTDYIRTARATGIPESALILKYTLKNASLNTLTQVGLFFGYTLTGSVLVENIFSWPGVGHYAVSAALTKDYVPLMGVTLLMGLAIVLVNLITDIALRAARSAHQVCDMNTFTTDIPGQSPVTRRKAKPCAGLVSSPPESAVDRRPDHGHHRDRAALLSPVLVPFPEDATGNTRMAQKLTAPNNTYLMGTDDVGRDVFSRTLIATQTSLTIGVVVLTIAILIGVPLGAASGFLGGWVDEIIMRITDIFLTVPALVLAMAMGVALGPGMTNAMFAISLVWWPGYARLTRGQVLSLREQDFVESARALGASPWHMIFRHIIPNVISPGHHQSLDGHGICDPGRGWAGLYWHRRASAQAGMGRHDQ